MAKAKRKAVTAPRKAEPCPKCRGRLWVFVQRVPQEDCRSCNGGFDGNLDVCDNCGGTTYVGDEVKCECQEKQ